MKSVARRLKSEFNFGTDCYRLSSVYDRNESNTPADGQSRTEISRSLKGSVRELDVPTCFPSFQSCERAAATSLLLTWCDSGSIEQDADVVMFIHREDRAGTRTEVKESTGMAEVLIEKHRNILRKSRSLFR